MYSLEACFPSSFELYCTWAYFLMLVTVPAGDRSNITADGK